MSILKDEELKVRIPLVLKDAIRALARARMTSESEIVREALLDYVHQRGSLLKDTSIPSQLARMKKFIAAPRARPQTGSSRSARANTQPGTQKA